MANPLAAIGIVVGIIVGFLIYRRKRKWWLGVIGFFVTLLAIATALHCIIVSAAAGIWINGLLYKWIKKNWAAFFISLLGIFLIALILSGTGKLYIQMKVEGPFGLGEGLAIGIGMAIMLGLFILSGIASYVLASLGTSIHRGIKKRKAR